VRKQYSKRLPEGYKDENQDEDAIEELDADFLHKSGFKDSIKCFAFVYGEDGFCSRATSFNNWKELNFEVARGAVSAIGAWDPVQSQEGQSKNIGSDCVVGKSLRAGDKSSVKRSIVGEHCEIGNGAKVVNSIVMKHVTIEEGVQVSNCVICDNVTIGANSVLKDSVVGHGCRVEKRTELNKETVEKGDT